MTVPPPPLTTDDGMIDGAIADVRRRPGGGYELLLRIDGGRYVLSLATESQLRDAMGLQPLDGSRLN